MFSTKNSLLFLAVALTLQQASAANQYAARFYNPGLRASDVGAGAPSAPSVARMGQFSAFHVSNFSTSPIHPEGNLLLGSHRGGMFWLNPVTLTSSQVTLNANWRGTFGFPAGNVEVNQVFPHPMNSALYVVAGDYSYSGTPTSSFVAIAQRDGTVIAAKYVTTGAIPTHATMAGNNVYVQATNGSGAMTCSVQATDVSCGSSGFGGLFPAVDDNGILHMRYFSMYGNDPRQVAYYPSGPNGPQSRRTVTGIPNDMASIAFGTDGQLYATVTGSPAVWRIDRSTWEATIFAGSGSEIGDAGGDASTARFGSNIYVQRSPNGIYVKDAGNRRLYEIQL